MQKMCFGDNLRIFRQNKGLSQKEFAELLGITQPSLSAYEKGRTLPTLEVLIGIAEKCKVSLDWLCGLSASSGSCSVSTTGDVAEIFYKLMEVSEINAQIEIQDRVDMPTATEKNYARLTFDWNDKDYPLNSSVCSIMRRVKENLYDLETYAISKESYNMAKEQTIEYHTTPLTQKEYPELSREELLRKRREYIEKHPYE